MSKYNTPNTTLRIESSVLASLVTIGEAMSLTDLYLRFLPNGLKIVAVDDASICFVSADIPLLVPPAVPIEGFFVVEHLDTARGALSDLDELDVVWEAPALSFESGRRRKTIKSIIHPDNSTPCVPPIDYTTKLVLPIEWLRRCVRGSGGSDKVVVDLKVADGVLTWTDTAGLGGYEDAINIPADAPPAEAALSNNYIGQITKMVGADEVILHLGGDHASPVKFEFALKAGTCSVMLTQSVATSTPVPVYPCRFCNEPNPVGSSGIGFDCSKCGAWCKIREDETQRKRRR